MEIEKRTDSAARNLLAKGDNVTDNARNATDNNEFVRFVVESTGRLGVEAKILGLAVEDQRIVSQIDNTNTCKHSTP